jgi:hypothetical protein
MLRRSVPTVLVEMLMILRIPGSEEIVFGNVSARLQDKERSTYVEGIGELSRIVV